MKDQDFYGAKNDYMAEAYVRVSEASDTRSGGYPKQIHLILNRPKNAGKPCASHYASFICHVFYRNFPSCRKFHARVSSKCAE